MKNSLMDETHTKQEDGLIIKAISFKDSDIFKSWRLVYYPPFMRMARHSHDVAQFSVLLSGEASETTSLGCFDSRPMFMEFKPAGFTHANAFGPNGALMLSINLKPDATELATVIPGQEWKTGHCYSVRGGWAALAREISSKTDICADEIQTNTIDLLTSFAKLGASKKILPPPKWLTQARQAVIESNRTIHSIATELGVHRVHLSRSFQRYFGYTISQYRREFRLSRAIHTLSCDRSSISTVSYDSGFSDQSHLTRVMRQQTGLTPFSMKALLQA